MEAFEKIGVNSLILFIFYFMFSCTYTKSEVIAIDGLVALAENIFAKSSLMPVILDASNRKFVNFSNILIFFHQINPKYRYWKFSLLKVEHLTLIMLIYKFSL